jgi:hypothetical protein
MVLAHNVREILGPLTLHHRHNYLFETGQQMDQLSEKSLVQQYYDPDRGADLGRSQRSPTC